MKKLILNLMHLLLTGAMYITLTSCNGDKTSNSILVGTWNVTNVTYEANVGSLTIYEYYLNQLGYTPDAATLAVTQFDDNVKAYLESTLIEFDAEYWYWTNIGDTAGDEGTWSINEPETIITLDEGTQWETTVSVHSLTESSLKISFTMTDAYDLDDDSLTPDVEVTFNMTMNLTK